MRHSLLLMALAATIAATIPAAASADPWDKRGRGHGPPPHARGPHHEQKYWADGCEVKREWKPGKYEEKIDCRGAPYPTAYVPAAPSGPPVLAPGPSTGLLTCNRDVIGGLIGGATGGLLGSRIGQGEGQVVATAAGTLVGLLIGGSIGQSMDRADLACAGHALEHAGPGESVTWNGPRQERRYTVTPRESYRTGAGTTCRDFETTVIIGGRTERAVGTACRQPDGQWKTVSR